MANKLYGWAAFSIIVVLGSLFIIKSQLNHIADSESNQVGRNARVQTELRPEQKYITVAWVQDPVLSVKTKSFTLYEGIKTVFDRLIYEADSDILEDILLAAQRHCHSEVYSTNACQQFSSLYSRYVNYKYALVSLDAQSSNVAASSAEIRYQLSRIQTLQREYFSTEEQRILFAEEQAFEEQALVRREIARDSTLTQQQKKAFILSHLEQLPDEQKAGFLPSIRMQALAKIKGEYPDLQQRLIEVENQFGHEAAERLDKQWRQNKAFKDKIKRLVTQYRAIAQNNLTDAEQTKLAQQALLAEHFSANQQKRARVMIERGIVD